MKTILTAFLTALVTFLTHAQNLPQMIATTPDALFKYTAGNTTISRVHKFPSAAAGPQNSTLAEGQNGKLYGLAEGGGTSFFSGWGYIFEYDPDTDIFDTVVNLRPDDGMYPQGALTLASNGKFYGVAPSSNQSTYIGTLFSYSIGADTVVKLKAFPSLNSGPLGPVIQAHNGKLYGTCGPYIFYYDIAQDSLKMLVATGCSLDNSLIEVGADTLYGFSLDGGTNGGSMIYRFIPTADSGTFTVMHTLPSPCRTYSTPLLASDGKLYGMTNAGINTTTGNGIFSYNFRTDTYAYLYELGSNFYMDGTYPFNDLYQASDDMLYGMTHGGGTQYGGVIFQYNPFSSQYTRLVNMDSSGSRPMYGHFMERTPHASILHSPLSSNTCSGGTVHFTASAYGSSVTQQWQVSTDRGVTFADVAGATDSTYTLAVTELADKYEYRSVFHNRMVADTSAVAILHVLHTGRDTISQTICTGSSYIMHGHTYTAGGTYSDTILSGSTSGCDSVTTLHLTVVPADTGTQTISVCHGQSVTVGTHIYTTSGTYYDMLYAAGAQGCDSVNVLNLVVQGYAIDTILATICGGDSFILGAHSYHSAGAYTDTLYGSTTQGCDSIVTVYLGLLNNTTAYFSIQPSAIPQLWYALNQCTGTALSYVWNWGDGTPTSIGATPSHTYAQPGYYDICVTVADSAGCTATYCDTSVYMNKNMAGDVRLEVVMQIPTGVNTINENTQRIRYYIGAFHFSIPLENPTSLILYDLAGREIMKNDNLTGDKWNIDQEIAQGVYIVHMRSSRYSISQKIAITR